MNKMNRLPFLAALMLAVLSCGKNNNPQPDPEPEPEPAFTVPSFAKGADISWVTEYEKKGYKFYNASGKETECTALMKEIGCNAVRYRVWVNPSDGWCNKADVLAKARRAQALGLAIMIDFHYSDSWADPGKQTVPAAWAGQNVNQMATLLAEHTKDVLQTLKSSGVTNVAWVQVGNETNDGMCWDTGKVSKNPTGFVTLCNAGYDAVKSVFPEALVINHRSNAQDSGTWYYDTITGKGAKFDMIGLSLYPSYWDDGAHGYRNWEPYCQSAVANFKTMHDKYNKPIMLVEFGMPASEPEKAKAALQYVLDGVKNYSWFKGILYWEPESEHDRNGYDYGAFSGGKSTGVMEILAK